MPAASPVAPALDDLRHYARLFVNRWDVVMTHTASGGWRCHYTPLTRMHLSAALAGAQGLGVYSVDQYGYSRWLCLDLDDVQRGAQLLAVLERLPNPQQALLEPTRRGLHLWVLVTPAPWQHVRQWGVQLAAAAGLAGIEVFPKGRGLSGVRAPLTRHPKDSLIYPLIDPASGEIACDPWALLASRQPGAVPPLEKLPRSIQVSPSQGRGDHLALVAEVERYTRLRYYGVERAIGHCPFHDDRHPSFGIVGGFWRCFAGCGEGGLAGFRAKLARTR